MKKWLIFFAFIVSLSIMGCSTGNEVKNESPQNDIPAVEDRNLVVIPDVVGVDDTTAKAVLAALGLVPFIEEEYSYVVTQDTIIRTKPSVGSEVNLGDKITLYKSIGPKVIQSKGSTITWWNVSGSNEDKYEFYGPFIEDNTLIIEIEVTFNSIYTMEWNDVNNTGSGFGNASINDSFVKVVPIQIEYEDKQIVKGETQNITLKIPLADLNIDKPTDIYTKLALFINGKQEDVIVEFTMTW